MFARDRKTPIAEWWWTIDKQLLSALILLMAVGMVLIERERLWPESRAYLEFLCLPFTIKQRNV